MSALYFLIPVFAIFIFIKLFTTVAYKDTEKKDKGLVFNYYKLSNRRKFFRALWNIPYIIFALLTIYWLDTFTSTEFIVIVISFFLLILIDIIYYFTKWKKDEPTHQNESVKE